MNKNILVGNTNIIAVYNGVFYEYHDESWHEKESWRTDDELKGERLIVRELYKDTTEPKSIPKFIFCLSELPRVTPSNEAFMRRLPLIPFCKVSEGKDEREES